MYATICGAYTASELSELSTDRLSREKLLKDALNAAKFMYAHGVREGKVFFSLTREGAEAFSVLFNTRFTCESLAGCFGRYLGFLKHTGHERPCPGRAGHTCVS